MKPKPMTRNDEIGQATEKYSQQLLRDYKEYPLCDEHHRKSLIRVNLYDMEEAFEAGARWADAHPDRKALLSDEANEREVAFCDAWFAENKQFPTFGHAIEWADRTMVELAICFIEDAVCEGAIETGNMARLIENFKEAMGYDELKIEN